MPRKLKNIASDSRKESRERDKYRKRLKRALESTKKKVANEPSQAGQNTIRNLEALIKASYAEKSGPRKGQYTTSLEQARISTERATAFVRQKETRQKIERKNKVFQEEIRKGKLGESDKISQVEVNIFYSATKQFWEGKPITERNEYIMKGLKVKTLEEAWNIVFSHPKAQEAVRRGKAAQKDIYDESEMADGTLEPADELGSPDYVEYIISSEVSF